MWCDVKSHAFLPASPSLETDKAERTFRLALVGKEFRKKKMVSFDLVVLFFTRPDHRFSRPDF